MQPPTPDTPTQIGPYRVAGLLGRGGSSPVYQAQDQSGRPVVVRLLSPHLLENPDAARRFERETQALAAAPHPNLLQILDTGQEGSRPYLRPYLVTEFVPGAKSLAHVMRERRLSVSEALSVMKGICRGIAHAHQHGVLHHHVTPHAILVSPDLSAVKLTEFGFSRVESLGLTSTLSTGAITLGAFNYLAPEQLERGSSPADHRADIYGVGAVFNEMLTGKPPGGKFTLPSTANSQLLPETDVIVLKCLARNPAERYATALELVADLGRLEETQRVRLLSEIQQIRKASPGRGLVVAGVVLLLVVLVLAGYLLAR
ncbi:MAG TPA: serine/threonine-protein kinase [Thermoanaerobaculia bacterium]|jgi:serine/threonine-protein kinase|nr:serine/threonine-protein kinase [Thermoanaerobaculia bacterium]